MPRNDFPPLTEGQWLTHDFELNRRLRCIAAPGFKGAHEAAHQLVAHLNASSYPANGSVSVVLCRSWEDERYVVTVVTWVVDEKPVSETLSVVKLDRAERHFGRYSG